MNTTATRVCPDCLEAPAGDQRGWTKKDGRCERCKRELARARRKREREAEEWSW